MSEIFPARTLAIEVITCTDPAKEGEFNWWYDRAHIPHLKSIPGVLDAYRYRDMQADLGELGAHFMAPAGGSRYLTVYRLDSDKPWRLMQRVKAEDEKRAVAGKMLDCAKDLELSVWDFVACRRTVAPRVRPETHLPDGMPEAMFFVPVVTDAARLAEQDEWWLYAHSHDLLETPGLVQCQRYRSLNPRPAAREATHVNIYEVDADDPASVLRRILEDDRDVRKPTGRFIGGAARAETRLRGLYRHCDAMGQPGK
jgi:hypothetical protein